MTSTASTKGYGLNTERDMGILTCRAIWLSVGQFKACRGIFKPIYLDFGESTFTQNKKKCLASPLTVPDQHNNKIGPFKNYNSLLACSFISDKCLLNSGKENNFNIYSYFI